MCIYRKICNGYKTTSFPVRFQRTVGPVHSDQSGSGSGSMEPLGRFTRTGFGSGSSSGSKEPVVLFTRTGSGSGPRFLGSVQAVFFPAISLFRQLFFWRFHGSGRFRICRERFRLRFRFQAVRHWFGAG